MLEYKKGANFSIVCTYLELIGLNSKSQQNFIK